MRALIFATTLCLLQGCARRTETNPNDPRRFAGMVSQAKAARERAWVPIGPGQLLGGDPSRARVTVIEFGDLSQNRKPALARVLGLLAIYGKSVRVQFRPIVPSPAAQAAVYASQNGKFWPLRKKLADMIGELREADV